MEAKGTGADVDDGAKAGWDHKAGAADLHEYDEGLTGPPPVVVKLDHLGPVILNSDGTMSRIPNWSEMTDAERESAQRLLAKRNARRKQDLLERGVADELPPLGGGAPAAPPPQDQPSEDHGPVLRIEDGADRK